ncbi:MAG: TlyA family RNA methyltransferase [Bacillota bacterium]|nr:TlyA family RNA methyltransferase [Bacillota bacterium]
MRLDVLMAKRGLFPSRQKAKEAILQGQIFVEQKKVTKPGLKVAIDAQIEIEGEILAYPSRAGLKLEKALKVFNIDVQNKIGLDVGASTGGFTACLLENGAKRIYAIDVGKDQLVPELRQDPRVIVFEQTDVRDVTPKLLGELVEFATIDVSFISLEKVMPFVVDVLKPQGHIVALIKPQFETGGEGLTKHGVVGSVETHLKFIPSLLNRLQAYGAGLCGLDFSPITGSKGNLEFLAHFRVDKKSWDCTGFANKVINLAWQSRED